MRQSIALTALLALLGPHAAAQESQPSPPAPAPIAAAAPAQDPPPRALRVSRERVLARYGFVQEERRRLGLSSGIGRVHRTIVNKIGSNSLRFRFEVEQPAGAGRWIVQVIRPSETDDVVVWTRSSDVAGTDFWSDEVPGSRAIIEILSFDANNPVKLRLMQTLTTGPVAVPQSITEPDERWEVRLPRKDVPEWPHIQELAKAVARLRFVGDDGIGYFCTGFLVSRDLILTNHHCINSDAEMRSTLVDFNYLSPASQLRPSRLKEIVALNSDLDYTLLRLDVPSTTPPLKLKASYVRDQQQLLLIEHPGGEVKQVSVKNCVIHGPNVLGVKPGALTDFGHLCDTLGGSSGSPVFSDLTTGEVTGLHHLGFEEGVPDPMNQAVHIGLVLEDLRSKNVSISSEGAAP